MVGSADARYLLDLHKAHSQTGYVFQLVEPQLLGVPINKCWLRFLRIMHKLLRFTKDDGICVAYINESSHTKSERTNYQERTAKVFEDNLVCAIQIKEGDIKSDITKHIPPSFFSYLRNLKKK